jgi:dihydrofolate synthase/folylpolyglutamate synthase
MPASVGHIASGLATTTLPGRFQHISNRVETIVDVAHNAQAVEVFVRTLEQLPPVNRTHVILGMLRVKDRDSVIGHLRRVADTWHLATLDARRGATSEELHDSLRRAVGKSARVNLYDSVASAYVSVNELAEPGDRIVALGSFLVVAEVLKCS